MDDHELARRWELLTQHRDQALRVALARTKNRADAEDLVSDAMIKAVSVEDLRPDTAAGLLSTIVIRLALDLHRRTSTHRRFEAVLSADTAGAVDERVTDEAEATWLAGQLIHLPVREREVLLHRAAGHTNASTAAVLGLTYKSVESAFTRARGQLQLVWKATAALVLGLAVAVRRGARPQTALATATLAASVFAIAVFDQSTPDVSAPPTTNGVFVTADTAGATVIAPAPTVKEAASRAAAPAATAQHKAEPTPSPSETVIIRTPPIEPPGGLFGIGESEITADGRTVREGIHGCLTEGLSLNPMEPGCNYSYSHSTPTPTPSPKDRT